MKFKGKAMDGLMDDLIAGFQKSYGNSVGGKGCVLQDVARIPTGIFPLDMTLGGGFPMNRISEIYGAESSFKTNLTLLAIKSMQTLYPDKKNVFVDIENSFSPEWAATLGVNVKDLYVLKPDYAEQAVNMIDAVLHTDDCGLLVVDSIAAMMPLAESEGDAERSQVGGNSLLVGKMIRKALSALMKAGKAGNKTSVILINQIRFKVGVMYGNPITTPGGVAPKFAACLRLQTYAKDEVDKKTSDFLPVGKECSIIVVKHKVPVVARKCEFSITTIPHNGMAAGEVNDWNLLQTYMKEYGFLAKCEKGGWIMLGKEFPSLTKCQEALYGDPPTLKALKEELITRERNRVNCMSKEYLDEDMEEDGMEEVNDNGQPIFEEDTETGSNGTW
jgi:recombination protein RecA